MPYSGFSNPANSYFLVLVRSVGRISLGLGWLAPSGKGYYVIISILQGGAMRKRYALMPVAAVIIPVIVTSLVHHSLLVDAVAGLPKGF